MYTANSGSATSINTRLSLKKAYTRLHVEKGSHCRFFDCFGTQLRANGFCANDIAKRIDNR